MTQNNNMDNKSKNQNNLSNSYMGNMSSKDIGQLPNAGNLGGEMVRRMIKEQEEKLIQKYSNDQTK